MNDWANQIEENLGWREGELASIKILLSTTNKESVRYKALLRSLVVLLYAHYEGFCKFAWDLYLDTIEQEKVKRHECCEEIIKLSLRKKFKELGGDLSSKSIWDFFTKNLPEFLTEEVEFKIHLETESNLWPNLLKANSTDAGLACLMADSNQILLKTLVGRRNNIAHGQKEIIADLAEYEKYERAAFEAMIELGLSVVECLEQRKYLNR
jgi:hypothetical protein